MKKFWIPVGLILIVGTISIIVYKHYTKMEEHKGIQVSTVELITDEEGYRNESYKDAKGIDTIGVGHVILPSEPHLLGRKVSDETVKELLKHDLAIVEKTIRDSVKVKINQNQFDALAALIFNIGSGAFRTSTLLRYINSEMEPEQIKSAWLSWSKQKYLLPRREREFKLYMS